MRRHRRQMSDSDTGRIFIIINWRRMPWLLFERRRPIDISEDHGNPKKKDIGHGKACVVALGITSVTVLKRHVNASNGASFEIATAITGVWARGVELVLWIQGKGGGRVL